MALAAACFLGEESLVRDLLPSEIIDQYDSQGFTPLHRSVEGGHAHITELLLQRGADPRLLNRYGNNALLMAALRSDWELVKILLPATITTLSQLDGYLATYPRYYPAFSEYRRFLLMRRPYLGDGFRLLLRYNPAGATAVRTLYLIYRLRRSPLSRLPFEMVAEIMAWLKN